MIEQITVNPINEALFSADFIKGFRCGAKRQFQADVEEIAKAKFDRPTGEWVDKDGKTVCSLCGNSVSFSMTENGWRLGRFCQTCGAKMGGDNHDAD